MASPLSGYPYKVVYNLQLNLILPYFKFILLHFTVLQFALFHPASL